MKKLNVTFAEKPHQSEEQWVSESMIGVNACYMALSLDLESTGIIGLERILVGESRKRIVHEVSECNRMTAFVTLANRGTMTEISFSNQRKTIKQIMLHYGVDQGWTIVSEK
jgi:hypothetical protein